jgi:hypothetical protein
MSTDEEPAMPGRRVYEDQWEPTRRDRGHVPPC